MRLQKQGDFVNNEPEFGKIVIFGVGLIGGSFALALKAAGQVQEVVGFGRTLGTLNRAFDLNIIDRIGINPEQEVSDADIVFIATPVGQIGEILERIEPALGEKTVVTDGASTKTEIISLARQILGEKIHQFVPAHPIAGAENSGPDAATPTLYSNKRVVITALPENSVLDVARVRSAWEWCGAQVHELTSEEHDQVFAAVSHLPHLLSYALVYELATRTSNELYFDYAASGFRDFTRIAASHPEMWRDICLSNRQAILKELGDYQHTLEKIKDVLLREEGESLAEIFEISRTARRNWAQKREQPS